MPETWRATSKADRRQRYLDAAARLFAERGFNGVSIDELGAAVGVSGPALYRHFPSKEAMLAELLGDASERLLAGMTTILDQGHSDLESITELVDFHIDFALAERDIIRIQDRELASLPRAANHRVRRLQRAYLDGWADVVCRLQPDEAREAVVIRLHAVFGLMNSTPYSARGAIGPVRRILAGLAREALLGELTPSAAQR